MAEPVTESSTSLKVFCVWYCDSRLLPAAAQVNMGVLPLPALCTVASASVTAPVAMASWVRPRVPATSICPKLALVPVMAAAPFSNMKLESGLLARLPLQVVVSAVLCTIWPALYTGRAMLRSPASAPATICTVPAGTPACGLASTCRGPVPLRRVLPSSSRVPPTSIRPVLATSR